MGKNTAMRLSWILGLPQSRHALNLQITSATRIVWMSVSAYERIYLTPNLVFNAEASGTPFLLHDFSGIASGEFKNPIDYDGSGMTYIIDTDYFEWGTSSILNMPGSFLQFTTGSWADVQAGELFRLGTLDYYNGSIWDGADAVTMELTVDLSTPDVSESFDIQFDLVNTTNSDSNTADQNADYVYIGNLANDFTTTIDGIQYTLNLAFGYNGDEGFATVDQFWVHEQATTTADLWGYFTTDDY